MELNENQKESFHIAQFVFGIMWSLYNAELAKKFHEVKKHEKSILNNHISKLKSILSDTKFRLRNSDEDIVSDLFDQETANFVNSILNISLQVAVESREPFEYLFENLTTGNLEMFEDGDTIIIKPKAKTT